MVNAHRLFACGDEGALIIDDTHQASNALDSIASEHYSLIASLKQEGRCNAIKAAPAFVHRPTTEAQIESLALLITRRTFVAVAGGSIESSEMSLP